MIWAEAVQTNIIVVNITEWKEKKSMQQTKQKI